MFTATSIETGQPAPRIIHLPGHPTHRYLSDHYPTVSGKGDSHDLALDDRNTSHRMLTEQQRPEQDKRGVSETNQREKSATGLQRDPSDSATQCPRLIHIR